jgi:asparagine synthase (glutamine-hydrolysing)
MCGIAGVIDFESPLRPELIGAMTNALRHRGPDDEGYLAVSINGNSFAVVPLGGPDSTTKTDLSVQKFNGCAQLYLGHRRLAILDLSNAGHQPMQYGEDLWIVFNGEIYNYLELKQELKAEGYTFNSETDTEVILAAYDWWGEQCVTRFNGDWAFCILDKRRGVLFLSRDRYGVKPLYFVKGRNHFAFASEIKALLSLPFVPRLLNHEKAFHYCVLSCRDHTEESLFASVYQLLPASSMTVDLATGQCSKSQYYSLSYCPELGVYDHAKAIAYAAEVRDLVFDAVRLRLRAHVPVGTCLSGGLDSSTIVAVMAKLLGEHLRNEFQNTFTASFPGQPFDESPFAQLIATSAGTRSHLIYPSKEGYWQALPFILYHQDEPFGGPSIYSEWEVMREASKHVKVILDGHAGDEVFAGYKEYRMSFLANLLVTGRIQSFAEELWHLVRISRLTRKTFAELKLLPMFALPNSWKRRLYRFRYRRQLKDAENTFGVLDSAGMDHIDKRYTPELNNLLFQYLTTYALPYLLRGEDRTSMAHSIEARAPFTDYRLVDYVSAIPGIYKIRNGWSKWLLRLAVKDLLPPEIVWRKDKVGFATPQWASKQDEWNFWMKQNFSKHNARTGSCTAAVAVQKNGVICVAGRD